MTRTAIIVITTLAAAIGSPANAQNVRSFVSGQGSDSNECSRTAPCRTFAAALAATVSGGEIAVLDSADYGAVSINKAISIVNEAGEAAITPKQNSIAIIVDAGPSDAVILRGLTIEGAGQPTTIGIVFNSGKSLTVQNSVIRNLAGGIYFRPTNSSALYVSNTLITDIGNVDVGGMGISVDPVGDVGAVRAIINNVEIHDAYGGIQVNGRFSTGMIDVVVQDTVVAGGVGGGAYGIFVWSLPLQSASTVMMIRSTVANYWTGIYVGAGAAATLRLTKSTVTGNSFGWTSAYASNVLSYGDNNIDGNGANESAPSSVIMK